MEKRSLGVAAEFHEDEFSKMILSWSLDDILDQDLYKNKVFYFFYHFSFSTFCILFCCCFLIFTGFVGKGYGNGLSRVYLS